MKSIVRKGVIRLFSALSCQDVRLPFSGEELYILETVNNYYGAYTPSRLRNMSHE